ncbi:conserved hypothetical protein [Sporisorium reilianum SRZ2]|uniref:Ribosome assembly protein 3 n=1 Tax=Sporisorium reilianum (strain SRZ2) TaxID=999809 RepID=E6ZWP7_SPORE|nr:conserved hypothetical protein [Sporisorium reilianum SRZ2]
MAAAKRKAGNASASSRRRRTRKTRTLAVSSDDSSSSSSDSSSESSSDESDVEGTSTQPAKNIAKRARTSSTSSSSSSSSSSSDSSSSSSSSSSSADSSSSDESSSSDSDAHTSSRRRRSVKGRITSVSQAQDIAASSSDNKRHVFRLTPEPDASQLDTRSTKKQIDPHNRTLEALEPAAPRLPSHLQRIVDAKTSSPSSRKTSNANSPSASQQTQAQREKRQQAFRSLWLKSVADEFGDELDAIRTREPTLGADGGTRLPLFIDALAAGSELFTSSSSDQNASSRPALDEIALASNLSMSKK